MQDYVQIECPLVGTGKRILGQFSRERTEAEAKSNSEIETTVQDATDRQEQHVHMQSAYAYTYTYIWLMVDGSRSEVGVASDIQPEIVALTIRVIMVMRRREENSMAKTKSKESGKARFL
jgi:hypothetical protein